MFIIGVNTMKKLLLLGLIMIFVVSFAVAENETEMKETEKEEANLCDYLMNDVGIEVGDKIPGYIPYSNEVMNIYDADESLVGHVVLEKSEITSIGCEAKESPTYKVYLADDSVVEEILSAESPVDALNDKLGNDIKLVGQSAGKKVKAKATGFILKIVSWFM